MITSLISLRSTNEPVDQQFELNNVRKTTDDEKPDKQKLSRLLNNSEKKVHETPDNKDHENNVCINPTPLIEIRISNITDITDNKTSTKGNIIPVQKHQIRERTVSQKNLRNWLS